MLYLNTSKINNSQGLNQHWLLSHFALNCIFASQRSSLCCLWRLQSPQQKTTSESRFFPAIWDPGIKLRLLGLATVIFAHWTISPAWTFFFFWDGHGGTHMWSCDPRTYTVEGGGSGIQDQSPLLVSWMWAWVTGQTITTKVSWPCVKESISYYSH